MPSWETVDVKSLPRREQGPVPITSLKKQTYLWNGHGQEKILWNSAVPFLHIHSMNPFIKRSWGRRTIWVPWTWTVEAACLKTICPSLHPPHHVRLTQSIPRQWTQPRCMHLERTQSWWHASASSHTPTGPWSSAPSAYSGSTSPVPKSANQTFQTLLCASHAEMLNILSGNRIGGEPAAKGWQFSIPFVSTMRDYFACVVTLTPLCVQPPFL